MPKQFKMKEITKHTGCNRSTILYYLSLGLLPKPIKTSKNMAYYPASYLEIIPVIRYLQENMHLPLGIIKQLIDNIGFEKVSIENALHYYETFFSALKHQEDTVNYNCEELVNHSNLKIDEISELENRALLFSFGNGLYSNEDLLAAKAYKNLNDVGISYSNIERLTVIIKKLAYEVHELYHENVTGLNQKEEQELTKVLHKELSSIFVYLMSKYMQSIYKEENK